MLQFCYDLYSFISCLTLSKEFLIRIVPCTYIQLLLTKKATI